MSAEWQEVTLGECAVLVRNTVSPANFGRAPYIGLEHIGEGTLSLLGYRVATDVSSAKSRFKSNDILVGKLRPYFRKVIRTRFDGICSTDVWVVRPAEGVNGGYLFYVMASQEFVDTATRGAEGTRMPRAQWDYVSRFHLRLPPLPEQRAIAHILGTLDDKIDLNRRTNETLEGMARAIFHDWFVDFGPVRAKLQGRDPYPPPELWSLFPGRLVDSELGQVPEGWEVRALGDCYDLTMGQSPPGDTYNDDSDGMPFFQGNSDFGCRYPSNRKFCTAPMRLAAADDTLVSVRAPVGAINMAWEQCCIGRGVAALRHKSGSSSFTYYSAWALQPELQQYEQTGTVFGAITKKQFEGLQVVAPPSKAVDSFETCVLGLDKRTGIASAESRAIAAHRDALLPRLLSGEVWVGEAGI